jgi:UDP-glucose 4-epimerase
MACVLLTGATGFLGGALLRRLGGQGHEILVLGRSEPRGEGLPPLTFLPADLAEPEAVLRHREVLQGVERVAHFAAAMLRSSDPAADDPVRAAAVNVQGTASLLAALPPTVSSFCYASTIDVYGAPVHVPVTEDHPVAPATYYGATKHAAEVLLRVWSARTGVQVASLRIAQVYGPGDTSAKAIPNFLRACLRGERPPVRGSGEDQRDYVYVDDVAEAALLALERRAGGVFNIAGGTGISMRELLAAIQRLTGSTGDPGWAPASGSAGRIVFDVGRARARLGWEPRVGLEEGLRRTRDGMLQRAPE